MLFLSHTQDMKKNPLNYETKLMWCRKAFEHKLSIPETQANNMYAVLQELYQIGYKNIIYVCGSDRIEEAKRILNYNGKPDRKGNILFNFDSIDFVQAGVDRQLNEDDIPLERISASLARQFAEEGNLESFKECCPSALTETEKEQLYLDVRKGLGLVESLDKLNEAYDTIGDITIKYIEDGSEQESPAYQLKDDGKTLVMGADRYDRVWDNRTVIELSDGFNTWRDVTVSSYNEYHVKFVCKSPKKIFYGVKGLFSKGEQEEIETRLDPSKLDVIISKIEYDLRNKWFKNSENITYIRSYAAGQQNSKRNDIPYSKMFYPDIYSNEKPFDSDIGRKIADTIYEFNVDGTSIFVNASIKTGSTYTPLNKGVNSIQTVDQLLKDIINIKSLSIEEKELLDLWWSTRGSTNNIAAEDLSGNIEYLWNYKFSDNLVNKDAVKNFFINQYATGYYYIHSGSKGVNICKDVNEITSEMKNSSVEATRLTLTHSGLFINIKFGDKCYQIDYRRKGSTSYFMLCIPKNNLDINRVGITISNLSDYTFSKYRRFK